MMIAGSDYSVLDSQRLCTLAFDAVKYRLLRLQEAMPPGETLDFFSGNAGLQPHPDTVPTTVDPLVPTSMPSLVIHHLFRPKAGHANAGRDTEQYAACIREMGLRR
ncbi:unnamed protein product [Vitrella brassicaformis CCMP3155]|uniref:Uncharacterized protein n=1 Tax=Vitrella brassicaformis (strain CCMP3155) TaxID=1169540 RepID=A0A0G4GEQ0_VITBC|nr:unnamed protein product [Vitrella brassicaformis CCMP3155]|eukprot:CEM27657.1 unnamed protein product [Vitrella brassicaformis CCMP3155]